jgi:hypothetical protein
MSWKGWKPAPLPSSFMLTAVFGFVISAFWVLPQDETWGVTFLIFFTSMFVASAISMAHAPIDEIYAMEKRLDSKKRKRKK